MTSIINEELARRAKENIITMIGCNKEEFKGITDKAVGRVSMSSGSWHADYLLIDNEGILAIYDSKGKLKFNRTIEKAGTTIPA